MQKNFILAIVSSFLLLCALPSHAATECKAVEVPFPENSDSSAYVKKAVKLSLIDRQWTINSETDTTVTATQGDPQDREWLTVLVTFDAKKASIAYFNSQGRSEDYSTCSATNSSAGTPISSRTYFRWANNLAKDIPINLQRVQILLK
jgi:hypothetical protein